jgi:diacylglycerol kinase family enzyme
MKEIKYYRLKYENWQGRIYQKEFETFIDIVEWLFKSDKFSHITIYKVRIVADHEVVTHIEKMDTTSTPDILFQIHGERLEERLHMSQFEIIKKIRQMSGVDYST